MVEKTPVVSPKGTAQYDITTEVLRRRYLWKDKQGRVVETEEQMFHRVAKEIAATEKKYGAVDEQVKTTENVLYELMAEGIFLPNSPTLMNAGRKDSMLSACFALPIEDCIGGIFDTVKNTALIQKAGGGTGFSFDKLRPTGDIVKSSGGTTSGPISFWRVIAETTNAIQQGAFRRGANMGMMSLSHPDILKFIYAKQDLSAFCNFNISVKISDSFMKALREDPNIVHVVVNPRNKRRYVIPRSVDKHSYPIEDLIPEHKANEDCFTIKDIWAMIVRNAHATGEPGVCFVDRINNHNPTPNLGRIEASNSCGEQPLLPYEACNLGSINVSKLVLPDVSDIDWPALLEVIDDAVAFLDDVIDANHFSIPEIQKITLGNRKIGLGVMGFADALVLLGIRYDSDEAVSFAMRLSQFIQDRAHKASQQLAEVRGNFPNWKGSIWDIEYDRPMRNAACTTIAPTGSISILGKCSSGIEPIFKLAYKRRALDGTEFIQLHPLLESLGAKQGWMTELVRADLMSGTDISKIHGIPRGLVDVLVTAHEIAPEWHVRIQAAFQSNVDNAVSKTVNLSASATVDDVDRIFQLAYDLNCKGVTVYRDNSRQNQVLSSLLQSSSSTTIPVEPRPRARITAGKTSKFRMGCGTLFVTVNRDEEGICEVFANLGKAGGCPSQSEATCRAVSAALRSGVDPKVMIDQLSGIRCLSTAVARKSNEEVDVRSCPDAIAQALEEALGSANIDHGSSFKRKCEECGHPVRWEANCEICDFCGHSKCG